MEPYYNKNNGYTMISYVIPLYKDGILFGVVGMDVDFEVLTRTAAGIEVYGDGCAHLLDKEKQTIYEAGSHDEKTTNFIEAVSKLENDMYMMLSADYFKIQRVGIHIMLLIFGIFIVVMTAAIIFTIMATRKIVRPIEKLTMATQDLVKGEIIDYLDLNSNDEIGILAKAFSETSKQLRSQIDYINELAYKDSLTGLKNSTAYIEKTKELDITMKTEELRFGLIVADINNLKLINDRYGHEMGNDLISATAKVLTEAFENLNVYRIGGDEFAVILVKDELDCIDHYLSKFDRLCSKAAITTPDKDFYISVSRGISIYEPKTDKTFEDVFSRADHNMYIYKQLAKTADTSNK